MARWGIAETAKGIVKSAIDRIMAAVNPSSGPALSDADIVSRGAAAWVPDSVADLIALTETANGKRDEQVDQAQQASPDGSALMAWVTNSGHACQECQDVADITAGGVDPDTFDFGDYEHPGGPNCECDWIDVSVDSVAASVTVQPQLAVEGLHSRAMPDSLTASAVKIHHTGTSDAAWVVSDNTKNLSNDDGETEYKSAAAWQDPNADADKKNAYSFWHHFVSSDGKVGDASTSACSSAIAVLNGGRGVDVKHQDWYSDRDGIASHVLAHLSDSGVDDKDLPKLDDMKVVGVRQAMKAAGDLTEPGPDDTDTPQWHAVLAVVGVSTGSRTIQPGAVSWRDLPITLTRNHDDGQIVGRVTQITAIGNQIIGQGVYDDGPVGQETADLIADQTLRWISLEPDETYESVLIDDSTGSPITDWDEIEPNTRIMELITKLTICAMSVVVAGAEPGCIICPIDTPLPPVSPVVMPLAASVVVVDEKPPLDWFTDPNRGGTPGSDLHEAGAYVKVDGYVAKWGVPHVGRRDRMCAPRSGYPNYPYFRQCGHVMTAGGKVPTGALTIGCGHAGDYATADEARAFYDNTGTRWAAVAAGEDEHGIWASGMCKVGITKAELWSARASAWSGDWRPIGGALELIASLSVNVPGFPQVDPALMASGADIIVLPTERTRCAMRGGEPMSLVAAGVSYPDPVGEALRDMASRVRRLEYRLSAEGRAEQKAAEAKVAARRTRLAVH